MWRENRQRFFAETWVIHLGSDPSRGLRMTMKAEEEGQMDAR